MNFFRLFDPKPGVSSVWFSALRTSCTGKRVWLLVASFWSVLEHMTAVSAMFVVRFLPFILCVSISAVASWALHYCIAPVSPRGRVAKTLQITLIWTPLQSFASLRSSGTAPHLSHSTSAANRVSGECHRALASNYLHSFSTNVVESS